MPYWNQAAPLRGAGSGAPLAGLWPWEARPARPRRPSLVAPVICKLIDSCTGLECDWAWLACLLAVRAAASAALSALRSKSAGRLTAADRALGEFVGAAFRADPVTLHRLGARSDAALQIGKARSAGLAESSFPGCPHDVHGGNPAYPPARD